MKKALPFRDVLAKVGHPDVFVAIEAKTKLTSLIKLKVSMSGEKRVATETSLWSGRDGEDRAKIFYESPYQRAF